MEDITALRKEYGILQDEAGDRSDIESIISDIDSLEHRINK